jgi:SAM-dependent methyltransferase
MDGRSLRALSRLAAAALVVDGSARLALGREVIGSRPRSGLFVGVLQRLIGAAEALAGLGALGPVGVRSLYRPVAPVFDQLVRPYRNGIHPEVFAAFDQALREHLPEGGRVLDLGCGTGANLARLLSLGLPFGSYTGVDLSPDMLRRARAKFGQLPKAEFRELDLLAGPLPEGPFDLVVSTNVFEHLPDAKWVVEKALGRLRPGGSVLLVFLVDVGLGHNPAMQAVFRWGSARFLTEGEYRQFLGIVREQRFMGRNGAVNVLLELRRPLSDGTHG